MKAALAHRFVLFCAIVLLGLAVDLATKSWAFERLGVPRPGQSRPFWLWEGVAGFQTSLNEGALFGMGQGFVVLIVALSIVAAVGVLVWMFYLGAARNLLLTVALGCVAAGMFGNLYDRLGLPGLVWPPGYPNHLPGAPVYAVRDWILVMIGPWQWPNFNVADSLLVCGAGLLLWHAWREPAGPSATGDAG